jgi:hypothetical protein
MSSFSNSFLVKDNLDLPMYSKQIAIFLSLVCAASLIAKVAPQNTFKIIEPFPISNSKILDKQIQNTKDKIMDLREQNHDIFLFKKISEFRINRLENEIDSYLKN